ncbi:S49 family peptidase [uncultured Alistipes sp.]|uniref:S49 family peptidase n=1 Tax=uncultured Alistipes sp. TaxID=538949 RepID=UPI0026205483|nr:S49 family peptidase [uncultured Alistipes sp.]
MFRIETTPNPLQLLSDVRRGQWFVHDHESLLPTAFSFLRGETTGTTRPVFEFAAVAVDLSDEAESKAAAKPAKVAVIPITGTITKYDSCFTTGAVTYARAIRKAADNPDICAIVLDIDSGGGAVNAIAALKEAIAYTQALGKPIVAHADVCASLAYWTASQCDAIFCDNPLSQVGSIGGLYRIVDDTNKLTQEGYTVVEVYADESADKNLGYRQALEGEYALIKKELSHTVAQFHQDVKAKRPHVKDDAPGVFTGAMFHPAEAQTLGLINGMMTLAECVENAAIRAQYNH